MDAAQATANGQLLRRALDLRAIIKSGVQVTMDEIAADEIYAMLIVDEEQNRFEDERNKHGQS